MRKLVFSISRNGIEICVKYAGKKKKKEIGLMRMSLGKWDQELGQNFRRIDW